PRLPSHHPGPRRPCPPVAASRAPRRPETPRAGRDPAARPAPYRAPLARAVSRAHCAGRTVGPAPRSGPGEAGAARAVPPAETSGLRVDARPGAPAGHPGSARTPVAGRRSAEAREPFREAQAESLTSAARTRARERSRPSTSIDSNSGRPTVRPVTATRTDARALASLSPWAAPTSTSAVLSASGVHSTDSSRSAYSARISAAPGFIALSQEPWSKTGSSRKRKST